MEESGHGVHCAAQANNVLSSSMALSGGYFPELDISLSPISKAPNCALGAHTESLIEGNLVNTTYVHYLLPTTTILSYCRFREKHWITSWCSKR